MFDQELIAQVVAVGGLRVDEIAVPDALLRRGELGRVPAERRLRPLDAARRRPLPAPPERDPALATAAPGGLDPRARHRLRCASCGAGSGARRSDCSSRRSRSRSSSDRSTSPPRGRRSRPRSRPWIARPPRLRDPRRPAARRPLARAARAARPGARSGRRSRRCSVGYLANNVLPARLGEVVRAHDLGGRTTLSRSAILGHDRHRAGRRHVRGRRDRVGRDPRAVRARDRRVRGAGRGSRSRRCWS